MHHARPFSQAQKSKFVQSRAQRLFDLRGGVDSIWSDYYNVFESTQRVEEDFAKRSRRLLGRFLAWMQQSKNKLYVCLPMDCT